MYNVFKSITKTAKENNLIKADKKRLFDFSIFTGCNVEEDIKSFIIKQCIKECNTSIDDFDFILYDIADNETAAAKLYFKIYSIEDEYKKLYKIYKAVKIEYTHKIIDAWTGSEKIINQFEKKIDTNYLKENLIINKAEEEKTC